MSTAVVIYLDDLEERLFSALLQCFLFQAVDVFYNH